MKISYFSKVVGTTFGDRQAVIAKMDGSEKARPRREPENAYDKNAVAIDVLKDKDWLAIGYIARENNEEICTTLDANNEVTICIQDITGGGEKHYGVNIHVEYEKSETTKKIEPTTTYAGKLMPEILTHPNIPKPLHGIAPRTIMGQKWWDKTRKEVYAKTDYHCVACGIDKEHAKCHQWLEAHEFWEIDYKTGTAKIASIQPLCHYCHNFIHSGRLAQIIGSEKSEDQVKRILEHGFTILAKNNLQCFPGTLELAEKVGADTFGVTAYPLPNDDVEWKDWRLVWNGMEYGSKFRDMEAWRDFYKVEEE